MPQARDRFVSHYGGIYEHSAWVAEETWPEACDTSGADALAVLLAHCVDQAPRERRLALIRAHPDLAGKAAIDGALTEASTGEQAAAGIDRCTPQEFEQFQSLNLQYKEKFAFPFVMAVRNSNKKEIFDAFARRLHNDYETEFATAMTEIHKIARLRLEALDQP